jgi:hypothetical protein
MNMHISDPQARFLVHVYAQLHEHLASALAQASTSAVPGSLLTSATLPHLHDAASQAIVDLMYAEHPIEAARVLAARR